MAEPTSHKILLWAAAFIVLAGICCGIPGSLILAGQYVKAEALQVAP